METIELIALIRDIALIVASVVLTLVVLGVGIMSLRLYGVIRRIIHTVEQTSEKVHSVMSEPMKIINATSEMITRILGLIRRSKEQGRSEENVSR